MHNDWHGCTIRAKCSKESSGKTHKIQRFGNWDSKDVELKAIMVPVVIGALGLIKRGMTKMSTKFQKTLKLKNFRKQYCSELHILSTKQFQLPELQPCVKP